MSLVSDTIGQLAPYQAGKPLDELERELGIRDAVKLASNENPLGPSPKALAAIQQAMSSLHRYPDAATYRLRERLAQKLGVGMNELLPGNGSNEILELVVRTFATAEQHVVFAEPSFVVYRLASLAHGVPFTAVPLRNLTHDLEAMADAVTDRTSVLFVANPNNPTGTHVGIAALSRLLSEVPPEVVIVVDEAYIEYADAPDFPDTLQLRNLRERLIVARTFSKIYGLAALRVGYAVARPELIDYMNRVRAPFNVSTLGQVAALGALDDDEHVRRGRALNLAERARLTEDLTRLGCTVAPSQANFLYVDVHRPSRVTYDALLRRGVITRMVGGLESGLRITVGLPEENQRLVMALERVLAEGSAT
jgi:histidinol-phosphate aminotransferase